MEGRTPALTHRAQERGEGGGREGDFAGLRVCALYSREIVTYNKHKGSGKEGMQGIVNACFLLNFAVH